MSKRKIFNWVALRAEFEKSDLSIEAFARLKGFSKTAGHNHLNDIASSKRSEELSARSRKIGEEATDFIPLELSHPDLMNVEVPEVTFIKTPVTEENKENDSMDIPIELKIDQLTLVLRNGFSQDNLHRVLEVLRKSC